MKVHRTYPIWLHSFHLIFHLSLLSYQTITFDSSFQSTNNSNSTVEPIGPGWHFRYTTAWILATLILYMFTAFLFDIILIFRGMNDSFVKKLKIHFDRFYCLMFSTNFGMGLFHHVLFFVDCVQNTSCPSYTETVWFIHLMPLWYSFIEYLFVSHNTKRDIKTTIFLPYILCLIYFLNYWLYVIQTKGHYPYIVPWPAWRWLSYFCIPLTMIHLRLTDFLREWLFKKRIIRSWCIYPPRQFIENPWLGWNQNYAPIDQSSMQPIDWKALVLMTGILLSLVAIWNISYLIVSR